MTWLHFREPVSAWTHFAWMWLALPATWVLWRLGRGSLIKRAGGMTFGFTLVFCYAASWLYHSVPTELALLFNKVDHVGIHLLIAGTVTGVALIVLDGRWRLGLVWGIWMLALMGITLRLTLHPSAVVLTIYYLFMGWVGCVACFELSRRLSRPALRPLWIGGLCYTAGAVLNSLHWPVLVPGVVEAHEVFHLFVMAGTACHYWFMVGAVLPYQAVEPSLALAAEAATCASTATPLAATIPVGPLVGR
jgi:hemolysin III